MDNYVLQELVLYNTNTDTELAEYPELLRQLLRTRGISTRESAQQFLNPDYDRDNHHPYRMKDMGKAVLRIIDAISKKERIVIYSDYDADGIPGAVVLHDFFKKIEFDTFFNYIPHRTDEGFGLNVPAVKDFIAQGVKLIITIDCGIADVEPVALAHAHGVDVIITDHHEVGMEIPPAYAILNPKQPDCQYPEKILCGSGVVFKLVQALVQAVQQRGIVKEIRHGWEKWLLDMVGLATLSDMVPLVGENRVFAYYGLKVLRISPRIGLMKLLKTVKTHQRHITEDDIGFMISPRINAASRMGVPLDAFKLLSTRDEVEADRLSLHLHTINNERKGIVASIVKEIKKTIHERIAQDNMKKVLVIGNPSWKPSLLGLAANTLKDDHGCSVFLWGRDTGAIIKGSCRSDGTVSVVELMNATKDSFISFGGHKMSGGFSVSHEKIHFLEDAIVAAHEKLIQEAESARGCVASKENRVIIDKKLSLDQVDWSTYKIVEQLAPFGVGNPKPLFLFERVKINEVVLFGKEKNHLELRFINTAGKRVSAISFFVSPEKVRVLGAQMPIHLVATLEKSMFKNYPELRLRIVDIIIPHE